MKIYKIDQKKRKIVDDFILKHWFTMQMVVHNLNALQFYQKRGFDIVKLHINAVKQSRKIKPEIPLIGFNGIPIRHEIELEMNLI